MVIEVDPKLATKTLMQGDPWKAQTRWGHVRDLSSYLDPPSRQGSYGPRALVGTAPFGVAAS
jgi:hypothetical protein